MLMIPVFMECDIERVFADAVENCSGFIFGFRKSYTALC
jgi:hypothetical protein